MFKNSFCKNTVLLLCLLFSVLFLSNTIYACTTIIVGKDVSEDGSAIFGRTDDGAKLCMAKIKIVEASNLPGTYEYYDKDGSGLKIKLDNKHYRYVITPFFEGFNRGEWAEHGENEMGVAMSATETLIANSVALSYDPYVKNGIAESNIFRLILPYVQTAKEGVKRLGKLIEEYGSAESNGLVIADKNEIWYMEIYTGHKWAAVRCPDDKYAVIANDAIIGEIDINDTSNYLACSDIYSFAKDNGFLKKVDGKNHLSATYNEPLRDYSNLRLWASRKFFSKSKLKDYDVNYRYDIFETPDKKIKLKDVFNFTRYRYEDTKYSSDIEGNNYRPIGIERTVSTSFTQIRKDKQNICWSCFSNPEFGIYIPFYTNLDEIPEAYKKESLKFDNSIASWKHRALSALATLDREKYGKDVRKEFDELENKWLTDIKIVDNKYKKLNITPKEASEYFKKISNEAIEMTDRLYTSIITKISEAQVLKSIKYGHDVEVVK